MGQVQGSGRGLLWWWGWVSLWVCGGGLFPAICFSFYCWGILGLFTVMMVVVGGFWVLFGYWLTVGLLLGSWVTVGLL